jgi:hypothetical protein
MPDSPFNGVICWRLQLQRPFYSSSEVPNWAVPRQQRNRLKLRCGRWPHGRAYYSASDISARGGFHQSLYAHHHGSRTKAGFARFRQHRSVDQNNFGSMLSLWSCFALLMDFPFLARSVASLSAALLLLVLQRGRWRYPVLIVSAHANPLATAPHTDSRMCLRSRA